MDKPMPIDKKIRRLCLHEIAFNTKTGILHKSKCIISPIMVQNGIICA